jgi:peptidoglycan L-alanyl-D-glutamate endopeptidase CwlK
MPTFSARSLAALSSCDERLQRLFAEVIKRMDCSVICGHRGQTDQDAAYVAGKSQTPWPLSKHNALPSLAADCVPYPLDWGDLTAFDMLAVVVKGCAADFGVAIEWGGDWKHMKDRPHFELTDPWPKPEATT